jgi:hypothetical protein
MEQFNNWDLQYDIGFENHVKTLLNKWYRVFWKFSKQAFINLNDASRIISFNAILLFKL